MLSAGYEAGEIALRYVASQSYILKIYGVSGALIQVVKGRIFTRPGPVARRARDWPRGLLACLDYTRRVKRFVLFSTPWALRLFDCKTPARDGVSPVAADKEDGC